MDHTNYTEFSKLAEGMGLHFRLFQLKSYADVPVVLAASWAKTSSGESRLCLGAGAALSLGEALGKAIKEMARFQVLLGSEAWKDMRNDDHRLESPLGRFYYYQNRNHFEDVRWFLEPSFSTTVQAGRNLERISIDGLISLTEELGVTAYPLSGLPDLEDGPRVVTLNIEELQPMSFKVPLRVNRKRLEKFAVKK